MPKIKLLSYNLWFENYKLESRMNALIPIIKKNDPDIMCFQEVTPDMFTFLTENLSEHIYYYPKIVTKKYETVFFSKYNFVNKMTYLLPTRMNRSLRIVKIEINGKIFSIANCHFESQFSTEYKNELKLNQYELVKSILDNMKKVYEKDIILCCDSNILECEENKFFDDLRWHDCWKLLGNEENKYTYDYDSNEHLLFLGRKFRSRLDRILFTGELISSNFRLLDNKENLSPSDHHGIYVEFNK